MTVERIPLEVLLGNPQKINPEVSPDGSRLSYVAPVDGVLNVWVGALGGDDFAPVTTDTDRGISTYGWCHDNRHLWYLQDRGGDENFRMYTVDLETRDIADRTPFEKVRVMPIAHEKHHPHELLIGLNKDNEQLHDVYHLDLRTGELTKRADNPGFLGWLVDDDLKVRGALAPQADGGYIILIRDSEEDDWRPLVQFTSEDVMSGGPLGFSKDGRSMYLSSSIGVNAGRLVRMDCATGEVLEVITEDPTYDCVGATVHPDTREPQIAYFLKERIDYVVLDDGIRDDIVAIRDIDSGEFGIAARDDADQTWILSFTRDAATNTYYAYDRTTKTATHLFDARPALNEYQLAPMEPFSYKARDGLEIHGYLTFPLEAARGSLPTVINVHGGPWVRDTWGFDAEVQWLANRGYLCVQVNYRGSLGYGKDFVNAGDKEWGGRMQDDLTDAVRFVVDQGFADPNRVCIYGGSYGGYAALCGATFTPDLFTCAIAIVGPSNLKTFIETIPPYWVPQIAMMHNRVGNPETDEEFLWSRSPLSKVDDIKIPMLIAHGANDPRVKLAETEQIVDAMKAKGIDHELMIFEDEGHGFVKPENNIKFYSAAERFLAEHL
jgi:dipeptidyl aminopeptidase/acylaminoacyl peptidase